MVNLSSGDTTADLTFPEQVDAALRNRKLITWLARWRTRSGFSQAEIARRMRTSQPAVARLESHQHDPQLSTLSRYALALKLSIDFVVRDSQTDTQVWRSSEDLEIEGHEEAPAEQTTAKGRRSNPNAVNFWQALDQSEREALRSVASSRIFAAGARLIQEGDPADHVIVILSGWTKICVEEDGAERIIAERGPGQLVGERGALRVSVRSAAVVALEAVQALVVRTTDFAAFISAHPNVLDIIESQLYDRLTEPRGRPRAEQSRTVLTGRPVPPPRPLLGANCTVILSDVVGFGARKRTDEDRRLIREALFGMTHTVLQDLPDVWSWDDRGDGLLVIVPPSVPTARVIDRLHLKLPAALNEHNRVSRDSARIQLRVAVNVGPVTVDSLGVFGEAVIVAARMVDAPAFKKAVAGSTAGLGVIASPFVYETVIRHGPDHRDVTNYSRVRVQAKEFDPTAWMNLFDTPVANPHAQHPDCPIWAASDPRTERGELGGARGSVPGL
jgi:transcriptional regulator with XRE-family HTH domain